MDILTLFIGLLAYLIGAIPTGYLIAKLKGITDIRHHGSGNIGATNVSRILGKHYFFLVFFPHYGLYTLIDLILKLIGISIEKIHLSLFYWHYSFYKRNNNCIFIKKSLL